MILVKQLRARIQNIMMRTERPDAAFSFLESVLLMISKVFEIIVQFRNALYDRNIVKYRALPCFVISVGNITVGGTGKTPMARYLARRVSAWGFKTAIITRGYGGEMEKKGGVVSDGNTVCAGPTMAGDEPYMLAKTLDVPVIVGQNRFLSARLAMDRFSAQVLILDDGFQHRKIQRHLNLLLMDGTRPLGNGYLMPRGPLREPASGVKRADWVVFTRSRDNAKRLLPDNIASYIQNQPQFKAKHALFLFKYQSFDSMDTLSDITHLKGRHVTLLSGIAMNSSFRMSCMDAGMIIDGHLAFDDHHNYTTKDLANILAEFKANASEMVATTHKDFTKLENTWPDQIPVAVMDVEIKFNPDDEAIFSIELQKQLESFFGNTEK
ncbi:MAG: tetraacyldisaccharide 4'-kinase [Desulfobacterales bacterium]|nr:MAG: tetraacyldisaccharide 4'-kinase [Desulfobacterales bacterium]